MRKSPKRRNTFEIYQSLFWANVFVPMNVKTFRSNHEVFRVLWGIAVNNLLHQNTLAEQQLLVV